MSTRYPSTDTRFPADTSPPRPRYPLATFSRWEEKGAIHLLELAISLPLVVLLLLGAIDIYNVLRARNALKIAAQESLRCLYPLAGECHAAASQNGGVPGEPIYQWWTYSAAVSPNVPLLAVDPIVASVRGSRMTIAPSAAVVTSTSYDVSQNPFELVTGASALGSLTYYLQTLPTVRLLNPAFLNLGGSTPTVTTHSYQIVNGTVLGRGITNGSVTSGAAPLTVNIPINLDALAPPNSGWNPSAWCTTTPITGSGNYNSCLRGWQGSNPATIPTILLIRGSSGGNFSVPPSGSPPVVRLQARIGASVIDLGGRALAAPQQEANFVPRGAAVSNVDQDLLRADNAHEELQSHANKLLLPLRASGKLPRLVLQFSIESNDAVGDISWAPTSIELFGPRLEAMTTPPLPCSKGRPLSAEALAQGSCDIGVSIDDRPITVAISGIDRSKPVQAEPLGCFVDSQEAQSLLDSQAHKGGWIDIAPASRSCPLRRVTSPCPPLEEQLKLSEKIGLDADPSLCDAAQCEAALRNATCNALPQESTELCRCCRARLDAQQQCPLPSTYSSLASAPTGLSWSETWLVLPEGYHLTYDVTRCEQPSGAPPAGMLATWRASLSRFAKLEAGAPTPLDAVIIPPHNPDAARALADPSSCPQLLTQREHLCSLMPKEPVCRGIIAAGISEAMTLATLATTKLPFAAQLISLNATRVGQQDNNQGTGGALVPVGRGAQKPEACRLTPCFREILAPSRNTGAGSSTDNEVTLAVAREIAATAAQAIYNTRGSSPQQDVPGAFRLREEVIKGSATARETQRRYAFEGEIRVPLLSLLGAPVTVSHSDSAIAEDGWLQAAVP